MLGIGVGVRYPLCLFLYDFLSAGLLFLGWEKARQQSNRRILHIFDDA